MANGTRSATASRLQALFALVGIVTVAILISSATGYNPLPGALDYLRERQGKLSEPATAWTERTGDQPDAAAVASGAVVVAMRGWAQSYSLTSGGRLWKRDTDWVAVSGPEGAEVVLLGRIKGRGYDVVDPVTGTTRWSDDAHAVWVYRDVLLSMSCPGSGDCALAARDPADGTIRWRVAVPGVSRSLTGRNPSPLGPAEIGESYADQRALFPQPAPAVLGFAGEDSAVLVDLAKGRRLRQEKAGKGTRIMVAGGRTLVAAAERRDNACRYTLTARLPDSGQTAWKRDGYDLGTGSGSGCEQRHAPRGGGGVIAAKQGDRPVLLSAYDGSQVWQGAAGEEVIATDGVRALARVGDTVRCIALDGGGQLWTRTVSGRVSAAVTRQAVVIREAKLPGHVLALDPVSGRVRLDARTGADVLGFGVDGLVVNKGRSIGYLPYAAGSG